MRDNKRKEDFQPENFSQSETSKNFYAHTLSVKTCQPHIRVCKEHFVASLLF